MPLRMFILSALMIAVTPALTWAQATFESGSVRPLALSPDGSHLFAANTPDNTLEIYAVRSDGLQHLNSVAVGRMGEAITNQAKLGEIRGVDAFVPPIGHSGVHDRQGRSVADANTVKRGNRGVLDADR